MKTHTKYFLITFFTSTSIFSFAQNQVDPIQENRGLGTVYLQNDKVLKPRHLLKIMRADPEAYQEMKIAKSNYDVGTIFGSAGGFLVGWSVGSALAAGKFDLRFLGVGGGLVALSIPFHTAYAKHTKNAVDIYNKGLNATRSWKTGGSFVLNDNGFGLRISF